jgi:transcription-repair coupling factor (superfamily II helicase)
VKNDDDAKRLSEEIADWYGPTPEEVRNLVRFSLLKGLAERSGVESVDRRQGFVNFKFHQQSKVDPMRLMALVRNTAGAQFTPAGVLKYPVPANKTQAQLVEELRQTLLELTGELVAADDRG